MMKLRSSPASPFVRKVRIAASLLGLTDAMELEDADTIKPTASLLAQNPLGKIPTLLLDDGMVLFDSRVICEYLSDLGHGTLIPPPGIARWPVLVDQALADGIMDAAVLTRYETAVRPESLRWSAWADGQLEKVSSGLAELERRASALGDRVDVGTIAIACALGYLDFRYATLAWRDRHPATAAWFARFAQRESMRATAPPAA